MAESFESVGPLDGLHVLDLSRILAGPYLTMLLGDLGAEVIKVERPGSGDDTRSWGPPFVGPAKASESTYFLSANRNKLSIEVDLKATEDRPLVEELVRWSDVLVENFRPGVMDGLGLSDHELAELNDRIVRVSISGFGDEGPERDRVGYDQILQAEGGLMSVTGDPGGHPTKVGVPIADLTAGLFGVIGALSALIERHHSGLGQRVSTSLLAGQVGIHVFQATRYLVTGEVPGPSGRAHPTVMPYGTFDTADGSIVIAAGNDVLWKRFAAVIGLDPDDPRFSTNADRVANRDILHGLIVTALAARPSSAWLHELSIAAVPAGKVKSMDQVYTDKQVRSQDLVWSVDHPTLGRITLPGNPLRFSRSKLSRRLPPPRLGEHSEAIRRAMQEHAEPSSRSQAHEATQTRQVGGA